jgi:hypothetical protein
LPPQINNIDKLKKAQIKQILPDLQLEYNGINLVKNMRDFLKKNSSLEEINNILSRPKISLYDSVTVQLQNGSSNTGIIIELIRNQEDGIFQVKVELCNNQILIVGINNVEKITSETFDSIAEVSLEKVRFLIWKKSKLLKNWIPLDDCLLQHFKRTTYCFNLWRNSKVKLFDDQNLGDSGFIKVENIWKFDFGNNRS